MNKMEPDIDDVTANTTRRLFVELFTSPGESSNHAKQLCSLLMRYDNTLFGAATQTYSVVVADKKFDAGVIKRTGVLNNTRGRAIVEVTFWGGEVVNIVTKQMDENRKMHTCQITDIMTVDVSVTITTSALTPRQLLDHYLHVFGRNIPCELQTASAEYALNEERTVINYGVLVWATMWMLSVYYDSLVRHLRDNMDDTTSIGTIIGMAWNYLWRCSQPLCAVLHRVRQVMKTSN